MTPERNPLGNPTVVLREEADDWALLFDPDTGKSFILNQVGVFIWQHLDGRHSAQEITRKLKAVCDDLPEEAEAHVQEFIAELMAKGMAGYEFPL